MKEFNEVDWKYLARSKKVMIDRLCNRMLNEIHQETNPAVIGENAHEQYSKVYQLMEKGDEVIAVCFNDWRRSRAFQNLLSLIRHQVITKEEIEGLSEETRKTLEQYQ